MQCSEFNSLRRASRIEVVELKIESYKHGMPCWICLQTPDIDNSKEFYSELFDWEYTATEMMPGMSESPIVFNALKGDDLVGVIAPQLGESDIPA